MTASGPQHDAPTGRGSVARLLFGVVALALLVVLGRFAGSHLESFSRWVEGLGVWGPLVFMVAYAVAVVAFVPASLLTLGAGAIFGLWQGVVYVFVAASVGAAVAFLVARYLARAFVERRLSRSDKLDAIDRAVGGQGLKIVFLLRLTPVVPFNVINYALGLTRVALRDYLLASFGMIPGTLLYVYSGKLAGDVAQLAGGAAPSRGVGYYAFLGVGFAATVAVTVVVTRIARRALAEATER